jgi:siroheme synthase
MGASRVAHIAEQLMAGGLAADTPVATIESATTSHQRVKRTTLGELPGLPVLAPAVLVIGTVAALDVTDSGLSDLVTQLADDNGGVTWHN